MKPTYAFVVYILKCDSKIKTRKYKQEGLPPFSGAALTIQFLYFCINLQ